MFFFSRLCIGSSTLAVETCDYQLTRDNGVIKSPRYPAQYPADTSCVWTITVKTGYYVKLRFHSFDVEPYEGCKTDMLEIKDGGDKGSPLIGNKGFLF